MPPPAPVAFRLVPGREAGDCAVACLATYCGVSYEDAHRAAIRAHPQYDGKCGLWIRHIKRAAKLLGRELKTVETYDTDEGTGILAFPDHVVLLLQGVIWDPDNSLWAAEDFFTVYGYALGPLLQFA